MSSNIPFLELVQQFPTPFFVYDEALIRQNYRRLRDAFVAAYPDTHIHYAVKANPHPAVVKILLSEGAGVDASSCEEIALAKQLGVAGERILFSGNYLSSVELKYAFQEQVIINLDDVALLPKLLVQGVPEIISLRINPGFGKSNVGAGVVTAGKGVKFGIAPEDAVAGYKAAKEAGVKKFGLHVMTGSCVLEPEYFGQVAKAVATIAVEIAREVGITFDFFDIGGGFGIPYRPGEESLDVEAAAREVAREIIAICTAAGHPLPKLFLEPGRYFVGNAGYLVGQVTHVKERPERIVGTNLGMNIVPRVILYDAYHDLFVPGKEGQERVPTTLTGQICEQTDMWCVGRPLPKLQEGDVLVMAECGAYCFGMSYRYNGRFLPAEVLWTASGPKLIRRAETLDDTLTTTIKYPF